MDALEKTYKDCPPWLQGGLFFVIKMIHSFPILVRTIFVAQDEHC